jgi:hypothetical protein
MACFGCPKYDTSKGCIFNHFLRGDVDEKD